MPLASALLAVVVGDAVTVTALGVPLVKATLPGLSPPLAEQV
jgi:hypothetical protein